MPNERVRIHEHKALVGPCENLLSVLVRDAFRICTWPLSSVGFIFKCATHGIRCSSAGGYQTALHYCSRPLLDWGWIACIRHKASCIEPRVYRVCVPCVHIRVYRICVPWRFRTNMCTVPPLIYISKKTYYQKYNFWFNIIWKYNTIFFVYIYFTVFFTQYFFFVLYFYFQFYIQFASPI